MSRAAPSPALAVASQALEHPAMPWEETSGLGQLGWLPALTLVGAAGLLGLAAINRLSASGIGNLEPLYWLCLLTIVGPMVARVLVFRASRAERLGLVFFFGLDLYLVKVLQSPFAFTYGDEFMHLFNANSIVQTGHLYTANSILPASALYPGLESATVGLMRLTGLGTFSAGLLIIGLARVVMMLALFLLYEHLTGSSRVASIGCVLYAANANFLYWSAQFSYESLALPLACLALYIVARRESGRWPAERPALTLLALVVITTVVVTHHLSSYFLAGALVVWTVIARLQGLSGSGRAKQLLEHGWLALPVQWFGWLAARLAGRPAAREAGSAPVAGGPAGLALFAVAAVLFWLFFVASLTLGYLSPVFSHALVSVLQWIGGETTGRTLFQSTSGAVVTPLLERVIGISSVLLCLLGLPFGLRQVWRRSLHNPATLFLACAAVAYFAVLGLRFVPSAWEIANRSSEFLFIGLALVLAMVHLPSWAATRQLMRPSVAAAMLVILAGGVIAGWPPQLRLAQVYQAVVGQQTFEPAGISIARWALAQLGPGHQFATDEVNGRFLLVYGDQNVLLGNNRDVQQVFEQPGLSPDDISLFREASIEYTLVDRRIISNDNMAGFFFDHTDQWPLPDDQLWPPEAYEKFDQLALVSRIVDSGNAVVYDMRAVTGAAAQH